MVNYNGTNLFSLIYVVQNKNKILAFRITLKTEQLQKCIQVNFYS